MRALFRAFDRVVWWALATLTGVMSLAILIQVIGRVAFSWGLVGLEEFAVLLFAWMIFLGVAYAQKTDDHLSVNSLRVMLTGKSALAFDVLRLAIIAGCSAVAIWQGAYLTWRTIPLLYPVMEISRAFLYVSVPVCFSVGLLYMLADIYRRWFTKGRGSR
jgi:TRAP-type C4-dicarboxylate transport system permease small subunit